LVVLTNITVRIDQGATDAISGGTLFARFELKFKTGEPFEILQGTIAGADVHVSFPTILNHSYQLQRRDRLDSSSTWSNVGQPVAGTGGVMRLIDLGGATNTVNYYRVQTR
jgi:hypothetical protein